MERGNTTEAKRILLERMVPLHPQGRGNDLTVAQLCFERTEYLEATQHLERFLREDDPAEEPVELRAEAQVLRLLYRSACRGAAPRWSELPELIRREDLRTVLERMCRSAIAQDFLRTADVFLLELRKLDMAKWRMDLLQSALETRRLRQCAASRSE
jgi:hypothetical protein